MNSWQWSFLPFINIESIYRSVNNLLRVLVYNIHSFPSKLCLPLTHENLRPASRNVNNTCFGYNLLYSTNSLCSRVYLSPKHKIAERFFHNHHMPQGFRGANSAPPLPNTWGVNICCWEQSLEKPGHEKQSHQALPTPWSSSRNEPWEPQCLLSPKTKPSSC